MPTFVTANFALDEKSTHETSYDNSLADWLLLSVSLIIGSIGLIGNTFVIIIIACFTSIHKQHANVFVINQSIIDAVSSLLIIMQRVSDAKVHPSLTSNEFASELYCRVWSSQLILWGIYTSSSYNLVALTIERYFQIVHPILHKTSFTLVKSKIILLVVWLFGILFQIAYGIPTSQVVETSCWIVSIWPNGVTQTAVGYLLFIIQYWLPLLIFIVAYTKMVRTLRRQNIQNGFGKALHENLFLFYTSQKTKNLQPIIIILCNKIIYCAIL